MLLQKVEGRSPKHSPHLHQILLHIPKARSTVGLFIYLDSMTRLVLLIGSKYDPIREVNWVIFNGVYIIERKTLYLATKGMAKVHLG